MNAVSFAYGWPWVGGVAALILFYLLFGTTRLQAQPSRSRWRDRTWLAWAAVFAYLTHNVEEYGVDALGRRYEFPKALDEFFVGAGAPPPNAFYLSVNISLVWVALPIAAFLSRRHPLVGLAGYSVMATNFFPHVGALFAAGYNPGLLTAVGLFLPMTIWMVIALFGRGKMSYTGLAAVIVAGVVLHAVLIGSMLSYVDGLIPTGVLVALQLLNAVLLLVVLWVAERVLGEPLHAAARPYAA